MFVIVKGVKYWCEIPYYREKVKMTMENAVSWLNWRTKQAKGKGRVGGTRGEMIYWFEGGGAQAYHDSPCPWTDFGSASTTTSNRAY